ncbi:MAG: SDR family NAD(P)-dependent oxidoreductase [Pseudochelatococcus sp.]|jgi:NADP-dependent 3-hydroxy acid dehydrogenase YdfG|uniref:SDR family NAD(P)-dependent oxidoreductase n=1 Tax=Pseudochelatococcus sp. TaxID=2020869 RepID=UPI003D8C1A67
MTKNWLITGASRGLGRAWAEAALKRGDKVAATARNIDDLQELANQYGDSLLPIILDVTDRHSVFESMKTAFAHFGNIDVVVSNAGYALFGTIEESSELESRAQFDANFFGTLWVVQAALPYLRQQGGGHILATSSLAGVITFPTAGIYNASKWAVEGLLQTLNSEVNSFGIKVTLIEPGGYATDWRGPSSTLTTPMSEYDELRTMIKTASVGRKLGDPSATASAILSVVDTAEPPLRLFLGNGNLDLAHKEYAGRLATWEAWAEVSRAAQE